MTVIIHERWNSPHCQEKVQQLAVLVQTGWVKLYVWNENTLSLQFYNIRVLLTTHHWNLPMFMSEGVCMFDTNLP